MSSTEVALPAQRGTEITQATAVASARAVAEVEAMVIVAQRSPRDMNRARAEIKAECGRMAMAQKAFYSVPNRGKGTTVHLAREMARIVGNIEYGVHELRRDDAAGMSEIQAYAWDLQTNTRSTRTFQVPHQKMVGRTRTNLVDLGDVYLNNQNIGARAVRECINTVLPTSLVEDAADWCRGTLEHGEGKPIEERRDAMVAVFARIGVTVDQLEVRLGRKRSQWEPGDIADASVVFKSIERGEMSKEEAFPAIVIDVADITAPAPSLVAPPAEAPTNEPEPVTSAPAAVKPLPRQRPVDATAGTEYGDVIVAEPASGKRAEGGTFTQMITAIGAQHGIESNDDMVRACSEICEQEFVSLTDLKPPQQLKVRSFFRSLPEGVAYAFGGGK